MRIDISDITLESMDGVLVAKNKGGHLTYPMLHLDRQPTPEDAQGFERVLIFVDGDNTISIKTEHVILDESNNYYAEVEVTGTGGWSISGVNENYLRITEGLAGINDATIVIEKADTLIERGIYTSYFEIILANINGGTIKVRVDVIVNVPLIVKSKGIDNGKRHSETLEITLDDANYFHAVLEIIRDREWHLEYVDENIIDVLPEKGNGESLQNFISELTITKAFNSTEARSTDFYVVSVWQRVHVKVNISAAIVTRAWIDPPAGQEGALKTGNTYIYTGAENQNAPHDELLVTFYYETSHSEDLPEVQCEEPALWSTGWNLSTGLKAEVSCDNNVNPDTGAQRYKIDVYRTWNTSNGGFYNLQEAGAYRRRLRIRSNNNFPTSTDGDLLPSREIFITIQPNLHVYCKENDLVRTTETIHTLNPLNKQVDIKIVKEGQSINLIQSDNYTGTIFIKANVGMNIYNDNLVVENSSLTWLLLTKAFRITRQRNDTDSQWSSSSIQTDIQGKRYAPFISTFNNVNVIFTPTMQNPVWTKK